jgi:hypothetical protein
MHHSMLIAFFPPSLPPLQAQAGSGAGCDPSSTPPKDKGAGASGSGSAQGPVDHQAAWKALAAEQRAVYEEMEAR